jgi:hypothetical protein
MFYSIPNPPPPSFYIIFYSPKILIVPSFFLTFANLKIPFSHSRVSSLSSKSFYLLSFTLLTAFFTILPTFLYSIQSSLFLIFCYNLNGFFFFLLLLYISSSHYYVFLFSGIPLLVSPTTFFCYILMYIVNTSFHFFPNFIYIYLNIPHNFSFYFFYKLFISY